MLVCLLIVLLFSAARPDVHAFVPKVSDDQSKLKLTCMATGFYPMDVEVYITVDDYVLKNQTSSEIRPNNDGSFQMIFSVEIDTNHSGYYNCQVIHNSLTLKRQVLTLWAKNHNTFCGESLIFWKDILVFQKNVNQGVSLKEIC